MAGLYANDHFLLLLYLFSHLVHLESMASSFIELPGKGRAGRMAIKLNEGAVAGPDPNFGNSAYLAVLACT